MGRFANAAKLEKEIGEMYENDNQSEKCIKHYQQAANYFQGEDSVAAANQCLLKVAHFTALLEKYDDAIAKGYTGEDYLNQIKDEEIFVLFSKLKKTSYGILFHMYCCSN